MSFYTKTSRELLFLVGCLLVLSLISWSQQSSFRKLLSQINPRTQTADIYHFSSCPSSRSLYTEMFNQFTSRIAGVSVPADATTNANRDPTFLQTWPTGLDFTGTVHGGGYGFTLISPRHVVTAWHLYGFGELPPGRKLTFRDGSGNEYTRSIVAVEQIGATDIALIVLDSDLPSTIAYYPVVSSSDIVNDAPPAVPVLYYDQLGDYLIRKAQRTSGETVNVTAYSPDSSLYPFGLELDKQDIPSALLPHPYPGDSGHPSFYVINNKLAMASEMTDAAGGGSLLGAHISDLNQAMLDLDKDLTTPPSNSYQVTTVDMSCFSPYPPLSIQTQSFSVDQSVSAGTLVGKVDYSDTNGQTHATGFTISRGNTGGAFAIDANGQITVANPSVLNSQSNQTFNLGVTMSEAWPVPDDQTYIIEGSITINVLNTGTPPSTADVTPPIISTFTVPQISSTLTISPITISASDGAVMGAIIGNPANKSPVKPSYNAGVTGYLIDEDSAKPLPTASGWTSTVPTSYTVTSIGSHTLYAWAKDAAGNVSDSKTATVVINVNRSPIASAGQDQTVTLLSTVNLSASASSDPDADALTYSWSKVSGPGAVTFSDPSNISTVATFSQAGTYAIRVTVSDGTLSSFDQTTVTVNPVADVSYAITSSAGSNGSISPSGAVTVNSGSGQTFIVAPNSGYQVGSIVVDGVDASLNGSSYAFTNVTADHTISVSFNRASDTNPPSIASVAFSNVTADSASISWITNETASTQVKYGLTSAYGNNNGLDPSLVTSHVVTLYNLSPNTSYHYSVISTDSSGNMSASGDGTFSTLPLVQVPAAIPTANIPPADVIPAAVRAPVYNPNYTSPYYPNKSYDNQSNQLTVPTSTPNFGTWTTPPSIPEFIWSSIVDRVYDLSSFIQYIFGRVVMGIENTL